MSPEGLQLIYENLKEMVSNALSQTSIIDARMKAFEFLRSRREIVEEMVSLEELKKQFRELKNYSIKHMELLIERAKESLGRLGCQIYEAKDAEEAIKYVLDLLKDGGGVLVKSKSNTVNEVGLVEELERRGWKVFETDLGERIVQLRGEAGSHPVVPAVHLSRREVAEAFSRDVGFKVSEDLLDIVKVARRGVRESVLKASAGITGANAITAFEGAILLLENEGNIRLVSSLPDKHIVIAGVNKIVPKVEDALTIMKCLSIFGTGQLLGTYASLISGPSRTADIELKTVVGMHGPSEVHVILLDNGRLKSLKDGFQDCLKCVNCGSCLNECPVYAFIGPSFGYKYFGGLGLIFTAFHTSFEEAVKHGAYLCTLCGRCQHACPGEVDTPMLMEKLRERFPNLNLVLPPYQSMAQSIKEKGNPFNMPQEARAKPPEDLSFKAYSKLLYYAGCVASLRYGRLVELTSKILKEAGHDFMMLGEEEACCGSPLQIAGLKEDFKEAMKKNVELFKERGVGKIVVTCPMCLKTFKEGYGNLLKSIGIDVSHITELLAKDINEGRIKPTKEVNLKAVYHDPCHLGRRSKIFEEPRRVIGSIPGLKLIEIKNLSKEKGWCCGGPIRTPFTNLSVAMSEHIVKESLKTEAEIIITACPTCLHSLSFITPDYNLKTYDLIEVLASSIGLINL